MKAFESGIYENRNMNDETEYHLRSNAKHAYLFFNTKIIKE